MTIRLKPLNQQTIVITGATSGIGLVTARAAARKGARVVLAARSEQDLKQLEEEIGDKAGEAVYAVADVADQQQVQQIARTAMDRFGGFDTWVNDAGLSIWGRLEEVSEEDSRRLFDTNFWGIVNGSLTAAKYLKPRGGAIINLGSLASDTAFPLQGMYCASKHAVKAFTDALRMELEHEGAPISVTLIKPAGIDTPFPEHAKNYMREEATLPPPLYRPEEVAHAILYAATHRQRDIYVGAASKMMSTSNKIAPRLTDYFMESYMVEALRGNEPAQHREGSLYRAGRGLSERGGNSLWPRPSLYTRSVLHPWVAGAVIGVAGAALAGMIGASRSTPPVARRRRQSAQSYANV